MKTRAHLPSVLPVLVLLAGCGGSGGSGSGPSASLYAGRFAGTFAYAAEGAIPSPSPFQAPQSGAATATIADDGTFEARVGPGTRLYGTLGKDGRAGGALFEGTDPDGTITYPATVQVRRLVDRYTLTATVLVDTSVGSVDRQTPVDYRVFLTPAK